MATVQAKPRSASSAAVGARRVTTRRSSTAEAAVVAALDQEAAGDLAPGEAGRARVGQAAGDQEAQVLLRREDRGGASAVASGAMTTSVKISAMAAAVAASSVPLSATMPPKAEVRSQS